MTISMDEYDGTQDLPPNPLATTEKPIISYEDFLYNERRIALVQRWTNINRFHSSLGCPLDATDDGIAAMACVIHGTPADPHEMTMEEFLGSYVSELPPSQR